LSISKQTGKNKGQALVELAVILPVLVLFMMAIIPLIAEGVGLPWLDERLTLRHLGQDEEQVHPVLQLTHDSDLLPPYFDKTSLEEITRSTSMGISIPLLNKTFPGDVTRKHTKGTLPDCGWWNRELPGRAPEGERQISRGLAMVKAQVLAESRVPGEVKKLTLMGCASGKTGILKKAGFNLFHIDLDALPETGEAGGKNEAN
jgi:hypothetical protein